MDAYDELFYDSRCLPRTHPDHLAALGRLMGLRAADPAACQVLELGCASAGNLIPMAYGLPGSRFVGVDLSAPQIAAGQARCRTLGLGNIALRSANILDLDERIGEVDYIIAHGVYSWVPQAVRERMLVLARRLLAPNGLFYVSFNTLPGWRMRGMLLDVLRDACRDARSPNARLAAAQTALQRLTTALADLPGLSAQYLRAEIDTLHRLPPSYLYFEYLGEHNQAFLFRDFLTDIQSRGLRYLCDADLERSFPSGYGEAVETALADLSDGADVEQWLDFIAARNFRQSLLIRDDADCEEQIALARFAVLCFSADLQPPSRLDLHHDDPVRFRRPDGDSVEVRHPLTKALLAELASRYPDALALAPLLPHAQARVARAGARREGELDELLAELFGLFARGVLRARVHPREIRGGIAERPVASHLARVQAASGQTHVTSIDHDNLGIDDIAARLIGYLDGSRSVEELIGRITRDLREGRLRHNGGTRLPAPTPAPGRIADTSRALLEQFQRYGVLEAPAGPGVPPRR